MPLKSFAKAMLLGTAVATSLAVSGCGYDGVQLNGKIFDVVGLNGDSSKNTEPKMKVRQPLVVPPSVASLPPPGSDKEGRPSLAQIQDPDREKKVSQADLEKQQEAYCKTHYEDLVARGDASADSAAGPLGACHPSIFTGVKKWMTSGKSNGDDDDSTTQ